MGGGATRNVTVGGGATQYREGDCGGRGHTVQRKVTGGGRGHKVQREVTVGGGATMYRGR